MDKKYSYIFIFVFLDKRSSASPINVRGIFFEKLNIHSTLFYVFVRSRISENFNCLTIMVHEI